MRVDVTTTTEIGKVAIKTGATGQTGAQGIQGAAGYIGSDGAQGAQGRQGSAGYIGADGAQGFQGIAGTNADATAQIAAHEAAADPHPQYTTTTDVAELTGDVHGIVDRTAATLSFDDASRTFTVTPVSGSWTYYDHGVLYTVSSPVSLQITNTSGSRFIRITTDGTLHESSSAPDFKNNVYLAYVYWNADTQKAYIVGDERHGYQRDTTWHSNQHLNVGTVWRSGGAPTYTLNDATAITLGIGAPINIADEDLLHVITNSASPVGFMIRLYRQQQI